MKKINKILMTNFTNDQVKLVSKFIQNYLVKNNLSELTADDCADLLAENNILPNNIGPKPGFNFRQMLRDGRDGYINLVTGAHQVRPKTRWTIYRIEK